MRGLPLVWIRAPSVYTLHNLNPATLVYATVHSALFSSPTCVRSVVVCSRLRWCPDDGSTAGVAISAAMAEAPRLDAVSMSWKFWSVDASALRAVHALQVQYCGTRVKRCDQA